MFRGRGGRQADSRRTSHRHVMREVAAACAEFSSFAHITSPFSGRESRSAEELCCSTPVSTASLSRGLGATVFSPFFWAVCSWPHSTAGLSFMAPRIPMARPIRAPAPQRRGSTARGTGARRPLRRRHWSTSRVRCSDSTMTTRGESSFSQLPSTRPFRWGLSWQECPSRVPRFPCDAASTERSPAVPDSQPCAGGAFRPNSMQPYVPAAARRRRRELHGHALNGRRAR